MHAPVLAGCPDDGPSCRRDIIEFPDVSNQGVSDPETAPWTPARAEGGVALYHLSSAEEEEERQ